MSGFSDPNFAFGAVGWRPINYPGAVIYGQQNDTGIGRTIAYPAGGGASTSFMYAHTATANGSLGYDFTWGFGASVTALAWIRSAPGAPDVEGQLAFWNLTKNSHVGVGFVAGQQWSALSITMPQANNDKLRLEFYIATVGPDLLIDSINAF